MRTLLLVTLAAPALAQDLSPRIPPRSLVELRTRREIVSMVRGRLNAVDSNSITLEVSEAGSLVTMPWSSIQSISWTRGRSRARGLRDGALIGLLLGATLFFNSYPWDTPDSPEKTDQITAIRTVAIGVGVAVTAIGAAVGSTSWNGAPVPSSSNRAIALAFDPRDQIRVESVLGRTFGRNAVAGDSLRLTTTSGPVTFAWRNVGDVQVRAGKNRVRGILSGAGVALASSVLAESFTNLSTAAYVSNAVVGGVAGWRFLSPTAWISLPQPRQ